MKLRNYESKDCAVLAELFYNTVHKVNSQDYSKIQLDAWATGIINISAWDKAFLEHNTIIAEMDGTIVGFGDMDDKGGLDKLFVHWEYQRKGIASAILNELEQQAKVRGNSLFSTHASITAKPFFEQRGYHTIRKNTVLRCGVELANYIMEKELPN